MAYQQVTFANLKTYAASRLGNSSFWTATELGVYINESLRIWNLLTGYWRGSSSITTVANQIFYTISGTIFKAMRVEFNSHPLDSTSLFSLDNGNPGWQAETATTIASWAPVGINIIAVNPADSVGGQTLKLEGLLTSTVLVSDADFLDIGRWQLERILDYVQHIALFKQGGKDFASSLVLYDGFLRGAAEQNSKFHYAGILRRHMGEDLDKYLRPIYRQPENKQQ